MKKYSKIVLLFVVSIIIAMMFVVFISCDKKDDSSVSNEQNKFFLVNDKELVEDSYIELLSDLKWTNGQKEGTYKLDGTSIVFYVEETEYLKGFISGGVLKITTIGEEAEYRKNVPQRIVGSEKEDESAKILSIQGGIVDGLELSLEVDDTAEMVDLSGLIETSKKSSWQLFSSCSGTADDAIITKTVMLNNGENIFYILVTSSDGIISRNYTLTIWKNYFVTIDFYVGEDVYKTEKVLTHTTYGKGPSCLIEGYDFQGWGCQGHYVEGDVSFYAILFPSQYVASFDSNGGEEVNSKVIIYNERLYLPMINKQGYTMLGWTYDNIVYYSNIKYDFVSDVNFIALWDANSYTITYDANGGTVSQITQEVIYDSEYSLLTPTKEGYTFCGWLYNSTKYEGGIWKTADDVTLTASWIKSAEYDSNNNLISFEYGEYPQTIKDSSVSITTTTDDRGYYLGNDGEYYAKVTATPFVSSYTFSNGTTITNGNTYYFKVEPIRWNVLYEENGQYTVMSNLILDSMCYYYETTERYGETDYQGNNTTEYVDPNNYKYSDVRTFLNTIFSSMAFSYSDQSNIVTTRVDNSNESVGSNTNSYICEDTDDKIFLLSYSDVLNSLYGFSSSLELTNTRYAQGTDYAKAKGLFVYTNSGYDYQGNSVWWLRSPNNLGSIFVNCVDYSGKLSYNFNTISYYGIRPAFNINL